MTINVLHILAFRAFCTTLLYSIECKSFLIFSFLLMLQQNILALKLLQAVIFSDVVVDKQK